MRTPENVARVKGVFQRSLSRSVRRHAMPVGIYDLSVRRILHKGLHYHSYKIQVVHALHDCDRAKRHAFCQQLLNLHIPITVIWRAMRLISTSQALSVSKTFTVDKWKSWKTTWKAGAQCHSNNSIPSFGVIGSLMCCEFPTRDFMLYSPLLGRHAEEFIHPRLVWTREIRI